MTVYFSVSIDFKQFHHKILKKICGNKCTLLSKIIITDKRLLLLFSSDTGSIFSKTWFMGKGVYRASYISDNQLIKFILRKLINRFFQVVMNYVRLKYKIWKEKLLKKSLFWRSCAFPEQHPRFNYPHFHFCYVTVFFAAFILHQIPILLRLWGEISFSFFH